MPISVAIRFVHYLDYGIPFIGARTPKMTPNLPARFSCIYQVWFGLVYYL